jgi:hypothetical protein
VIEAAQAALVIHQTEPASAGFLMRLIGSSESPPGSPFINNPDWGKKGNHEKRKNN